MARARNLKPSFFTNELLGSCPAWVRLLFEGLWCLADREGRLEDRPARIKAEVLPYDDEDVAAGLAMLAEKGFIERYEVKGRSFIHIVNFHKHQHPHPKETCGNYPGPSGNFREFQETSGNFRKGFGQQGPRA